MFENCAKDRAGRIQVRGIGGRNDGKLMWRYSVDVKEMLEQDPPSCELVEDGGSQDPAPSAQAPKASDPWKGTTVPELREIAKRLPSEPTGVGDMNRGQLIELLAKNDVLAPLAD